MVVEDVIKALDGSINVKIYTKFGVNKTPMTYYEGLAHDVPYRNIHLNIVAPIDVRDNCLFIEVD